MDHTTGTLQVVPFTASLTIVVGIVHIVGALMFRQAGLDSKDKPTISCDLPPSETSQLLPQTSQDEFIPELHLQADSALSFLRQGQVWLLILFCICIFGAVSPVSLT